MDVFGHTDDVDGSRSRGTSDVGTDMGGLLFGADARLTERAVVGVLVGGSTGDQNFDGLSGKNDLDGAVGSEA